MKKTINKTDFVSAFNKSDTYKNNFTHEGLHTLYDFLIETEESTGEEMELDIVALCCEFCEYSSIRECYEEYEYSAGKNYIELGEDNETRDEKALEYLNYNTIVMTMESGGIIISNF